MSAEPSRESSGPLSRHAVGRPSGPAPARAEREGGTVFLMIAAVGAALASLAATLYFGRALPAEASALDTSGRLTQSGLPIAELGMNVAGTITVGLLLAAALLLPAGDGGLTPLARRCLAAARRCALAWAVASLATVVLSLSYTLGVPISDLSPSDVFDYALRLADGRALALVALAALLVALAAPRARTAAGAGGLLLVAVAGLLPPVFTGHSAIAADHALAAYSLAVHVVAAAVWVGGLVVLVCLAGPLHDRLPDVVPRYSALAGVCFAAVAASGLLNAWVRLGGLGAFSGSRYGLLVVAKASLLIGLGLFGRWHRRAGIPALLGRNGRPSRRIFVRLASMEVLVMAAALALATGLSRSEPPPEPGLVGPTATLLGYRPPGPPSVRAFVFAWRPDLLFLLLVAAGAALYLAGVLRLRRSGERWPVARSVAWGAGLAVVYVAALGGPARYSMAMFSANMVQHLALSLLAPIGLILGSPVTLARRALRPGPAASGLSARQVLEAVFGSRVLRVFSHPLIATAVLLITLYGFQGSPLFQQSLQDHALHSAVMVVFLIAGVLYLRPVLAPEHDGRGRRPAALRTPGRGLAVLLAAVPFHAVFGLGFLTSDTALAGEFFATLGHAWGASPIRDQRMTGLIIWAVTGAVTAALIAPAWRNERRATARPPARP